MKIYDKVKLKEYFCVFFGHGLLIYTSKHVLLVDDTLTELANHYANQTLIVSVLRITPKSRTEVYAQWRMSITTTPPPPPGSLLLAILRWWFWCKSYIMSRCFMSYSVFYYYLFTWICKQHLGWWRETRVLCYRFLASIIMVSALRSFLFSWCLTWAAFFYCDTPWTFHIIILCAIPRQNPFHVTHLTSRGYAALIALIKCGGLGMYRM